MTLTRRFNLDSKLNALRAVVVVAGGLVALAATPVAHAGNVNWSVGVALPGVPVGTANPQRVVYAPQVYAQPTAVYSRPGVAYAAPAQVYVQPQQMYYPQQPVYDYQQQQQVYVQPQTVYAPPQVMTYPPAFYAQSGYPPVVYAPAPVYRNWGPGFWPGHHVYRYGGGYGGSYGGYMGGHGGGHGGHR